MKRRLITFQKNLKLIRMSQILQGLGWSKDDAAEMTTWVIMTSARQRIPQEIVIDQIIWEAVNTPPHRVKKKVTEFIEG